MRQLPLFLGLLLAFTIIALPAFAGSRRYIVDVLDEWIIIAEGEGCEVFYTDIDRIDEDHSISYQFELEPGVYTFYAEGGEDIEDLDMYVYNERGRELDSDTLTDNYPFCEIELDRAQEIEIEIVVYSFYGREDEDYFCFLAAARIGMGWGGGDVDEILDYWIDWAEESGYEVILTQAGELRRDDSEFYAFRLQPGSYHVYAESIDEDDDIDLYVYDQDGDELGSDTLGDNYPIVSFDLRRSEEVEIEVLPYVYARDNSTEYALVIAVEGRGGITGPEGGRPDHARLTDESDWEYIHGALDDYMAMVIDEGYEMIFDQVELVEEGSTHTFRITLGRGDYIAYAEGGLRIADLDMHVYDEDGYLVVEDTLTDNYPVCEFSCRRSTTFEIEIDPYEMEGGYDEGYFLLVVVRE